MDRRARGRQASLAVCQPVHCAGMLGVWAEEGKRAFVRALNSFFSRFLNFAFFF